MIVTGIGQCSLDYLAFVDSYPEVDTKKEVIQWHEQGGGPVATALVSLARLGLICRFLGITGDDEAGGKIRQSLMEEGVDVSGLVQREKSSSQLAFIAIEKRTAKRTIFWKRPSGEPLRKEELGPDFLKGSDFLLLDGLMGESSLHAAGIAGDAGIPVMLDAGSVRPGILEIAGTCDYVVSSEHFAIGLGWEITGDSLNSEREKLGVKVLTVTLGNRGSITAAGDRFIETPAFTVDAVDTTGAGDVFHGGYIYGVLQGWDLNRTLIFASAFAALKCKNVGGRTGIPSLSEVREFLVSKNIPSSQQP
jgi:sulfofructose kinase